MVTFTAAIQKFEKKGEKSGWTYFAIPPERADALNPGVKTAYRVKGKLDNYSVEQIAILPMGDGTFILPLNATMRKGLKKGKGDNLSVQLEIDASLLQLDADFMDCLKDEPSALTYFQSLAAGHRNYFSKWIQSAKTEKTKAKRIAMAVTALAQSTGFPEMLRDYKKYGQDLGL